MGEIERAKNVSEQTCLKGKKKGRQKKKEKKNRKTARNYGDLLSSGEKLVSGGVGRLGR